MVVTDPVEAAKLMADAKGRVLRARPKLPRKRVIRDIVQGSVPSGKLKNVPVTVADTRDASIGGGVKYKDRAHKLIEAVLVPEGTGAYDSTVRGHETRHATWPVSARKLKKGEVAPILTKQRAMANQIVQDDFIEQKPIPRADVIPLPTLRKYKRRALATAMRDIREGMKVNRLIAKGKIPNDAASRNAKLLSGTRALAMISKYGEVDYDPTYPLIDQNTARTVSRAMKAIKAKLFNDDPTLISGIAKVIELAQKPRTIPQAIDLLTTLQENEVEEKPREEEPNGRPPTEPIEDVPVKPENEVGGEMTIIELRPRQTATVKTRTIGFKYAPSGTILNAHRYVPAIVSNDANGLFKRRMRNKIGGTVLIDASGSMGATSQNLSELCKAMPTATVAYYSGNRGSGHLCVYARDGKRYDGPIVYKHGGNDIDLNALLWLMRQPKPWIFITDMQFCGGKTGQAEMTQAIVRRLVKRGDLLIIPSFREAFLTYGNEEQKKRARMIADGRADKAEAMVARLLPDWLRDALRGVGGQILPLRR